MVLIIAIYCSIFIYVKINMYQVSKAIVQASLASSKQDTSKESIEEASIMPRVSRGFRLLRRSFKGGWRNAKIFISYFPGFGSLNPLLEEERRIRNSPPREPVPSPVEGRSAATEMSNLSTLINEDFQQQLNRENIVRFRHRRNIIERQVNSIFIYPLTYVLLYIFPLIQQFLYYTQNRNSHRDNNTEPIYWLALVASWMKPFNCFIDTCVFVYREGAIPFLGPSRRAMVRTERYGALVPDVVPRPSQPHSATAPLVIRRSHAEYYSGTDIEIDYVIENESPAGSDRQRNGVIDEENMLQERGVRNTIVISSDPPSRGSSAWLSRITGVQHLQGKDHSRQTLQVPGARHHDSSSLSIQSKKSQSSEDAFTKRWVDYTFTPLNSHPGTPANNTAVGPNSTLSPPASTEVSPTFRSVDHHKDQDPSDQDPIDPHNTTVPPVSPLRLDHPTPQHPCDLLSDVHSPPASPPHIGDSSHDAAHHHHTNITRIARAATLPIRHVVQLHQQGSPRCDPAYLNAQQQAKARRNYYPPRYTRAMTAVFGLDHHDDDDFNDFYDHHNHPGQSLSVADGAENEEMDVSEMSLRDFLERFAPP